MSDTMLFGILRMPFDLAMSTPTSQLQYHQRGQQAADEIERLRAEIERLREKLHRISLASQSSMSSKEECGRIARAALEAKP